MKKLLVFIIGLSVHSLASADWRVDKRVDAMTDEAKKTAIVQNEVGHIFSIYRLSEGGPVWGNFALADGIFDQIDWEKPPIYRVDKYEPINLIRMKRTQEMGLGIQAYEWGPKWVNFRIWHGKEDEGIANELVQLMEGNNIVFRYYLSTGGYKDTSFSLKGAASAISGAIGISSKIDHLAQQRSEEFKQALLAESKRCQQNMKTFKSCFSRVNDCRKQVENDIDKLKSCMQ
ncbi:MAG: hypothetical protein BMS9Abin33_1058 [Gammaproteobacteria bacterium]|nr:MAG: hypothetical protein BMS9Abin33_1058 [Gammaproteobacteria bacterium]